MIRTSAWAKVTGYERRENLPAPPLEVVEDAQLSEESRSVVIDSLAGESLPVFEREHCTRVELDLPAGAREAPPVPIVGSSDGRLSDHVVVGEVALVDIDVRSGSARSRSS
jgi:hypothetical protein